MNVERNQANPPAEAERIFKAVVYVDGFNLYHGMRERSLRRFYWLDLWELAKRLCTQREELQLVRYFTTRVPGAKLGRSIAENQDAEASRSRQNTFLDALRLNSKIHITYGKFIECPAEGCEKCGHYWFRQEEKETDVNLAVSVLTDAINDEFDVAYIISGDSDQAPTIRALKALRPKKRVVAVFPPNRVSTELKKLSDRVLYINENHLRASQLPDEIQTEGIVIRRPVSWI